MSRRHAPPPELVAEAAADPAEPPWRLLRESYFLLKERWGRRLGAFELTMTDYHVLDRCAVGPARASEVARVTGVTASGATDAIDRLTARGLVERAADPSDRRVVRIRLTAAGVRLHRAASAAKHQTVRSLDEALTDRERRALREGLGALARALRESAGPPGGNE